jgi:hypothetical protein
MAEIQNLDEPTHYRYEKNLKLVIETDYRSEFQMSTAGLKNDRHLRIVHVLLIPLGGRNTKMTTQLK